MHTTPALSAILLDSPEDSEVAIYISLFSIITLALVAIIVYFWTTIFRQKRRIALLESSYRDKENRYDEEFEVCKDQGVATKILEVEKRNKLVEKIQVKLERMRDRLPQENSTAISALIGEVNSMAENDLWDNFDEYFKESHPNFIKDLSHRFPDLTANEIKVCALIRINITSKDISEISDLSIKSIEAIRTKLRRKFDLSNTDIYLGDFLKQF
jgi:Bacterial regulatory proteins, luxR family.